MKTYTYLLLEQEKKTRKKEENKLNSQKKTLGIYYFLLKRKSRNLNFSVLPKQKYSEKKSSLFI